MKYYFGILLLFFFLNGCVEQRQEGKAVVSGNIAGAEGDTVFLEELTPDNLIRIDSAKINKDGGFRLVCQPEETGIYLVKIGKDGFIAMVLGIDDHVEVISDRSGFPDRYQISGNDGSKLLHDYFSETARKQEVLDSLSKTFHNSATFSDFYRIKIELDSAFAALFAEQKNFAHRLVSENPGSLASLLIFNRQFAGKKLFDPKEDAGLMLLLDSLLMKNYPGNSHVEAHHNRVQRFLQQRREDEAAEKRLAPGKTAPPLNLPDTSGRMITLKSLQGNIVLLCFWASYSPESRACLQQLKNVYTKYHKAGFRVYAVSFDHKRSFWANVIRMEQLPWINVSDLKGLNSPVKILYHLNDDDIPYFYLIDKSGKIILKGDDLNAVENLLTAMQ